MYICQNLGEGVRERQGVRGQCLFSKTADWLELSLKSKVLRQCKRKGEYLVTQILILSCEYCEHVC